MSENEEPDWLAELAKGGDAVRRQIELLLQGAQQFVRDSQQAAASGGPVPPVPYRVVRAVGAAVRELAPARQPVVRHVALHDAGGAASTLAMAGLATATGSAPMPRVSADAERSIGRILALVLVALATWRLLVVPEHDRAAVDHYVTVLGFGLTLAVLIWSKQNKPK